MQNYQSLNLSLFSILLSVAAYFFLIRENGEESLSLKNIKDNPVPYHISKPVVVIEAEGVYLHDGKSYELEELVNHLALDFYSGNSQDIHITARSDIRHQTVVELTDKLKQRIPEAGFSWD